VQPHKTRHRDKKLIALGIFAILTVTYSILRVNWMPAITPDGLNYLNHSNNLLEIGFVQQGYRQFGYPTWLAFVDTISVIGSVEPLGLTVVLQRLLLIASAGVAVWVLRAWSVPIVFILLAPSTIAFSNFILMETISIPIAVFGAIACVALLQNDRLERSGLWMVTAAVAGAVLPMIRLHYVVISVGIVVAILAAGRAQKISRRSAVLSVSVLSMTLGLLVGALALENLDENDVFFPSVGAERNMFWATWENVVVSHREEVARRLPDVFLDGDDYAFVRQMDGSGLSAGDQRAVYARVVDEIYVVTGVNKTVERLRSALGVMTGSRLDDTGAILRFLASPTPPTDFDLYIHQYGGVPGVDPGSIALRYNRGMAPTVVLAVADVLPALPSPDLGVMMLYLIPVLLLVGTYLLRFDDARIMAGIAIGVILVYAAASFLFMMDNMRFLLPAYMFSIAVGLGAIRQYWRHDRA
jgi:hypothetical protein